MPALARRPAVVLGLLRPRRLLGVARRRAPGRGGLRRRAGRPGLAARRPPPVQLPPRPRHHAPRARRDARAARRPPPWATWHANDMVVASNGQAYAGNFGFDLDGLYDGTVDAERHRPDLAHPRRPRRHAAPRRRRTSGSPTARSSPTTARTLIIAESFGGRLTAFDREADGTLTNRREWAALDGRRARRHLPVRRRLGLGRQRAGGRMRARRRRRRDPRARGHVA